VLTNSTPKHKSHSDLPFWCSALGGIEHSMLSHERAFEWQVLLGIFGWRVLRNWTDSTWEAMIGDWSVGKMQKMSQGRRPSQQRDTDSSVVLPLPMPHLWASSRTCGTYRCLTFSVARGLSEALFHMISSQQPPWASPSTGSHMALRRKQ
jgi:hypothetical protein